MKILGIISLVASILLYWIIGDQGKDLSVGSIKIELMHCGILFAIAMILLIWGIARETRPKYQKYS